MSAVVDDVEGDKSEVVEGKIKPLLTMASKPSLEITEKFNKTVMLTLSLPENNNKCEVS